MVVLKNNGGGKFLEWMGYISEYTVVKDCGYQIFDKLGFIPQISHDIPPVAEQ